MGLAIQCAPLWTPSSTTIAALTEHTLWLVADNGTLLCHLLLDYPPATLCVVPRGGDKSTGQSKPLVHNVLVGTCPPPASELTMWCMGLDGCEGIHLRAFT